MKSNLDLYFEEINKELSDTNTPEERKKYLKNKWIDLMCRQELNPYEVFDKKTPYNI
jgi:hypothetical protein